MPDTLGPYRLGRRLGEGGMGVVYEAEDSRLGRTVALKTLREGSDAQLRERLLREARAAASVKHPGVCQVFDVGEADGQTYIAMELLEGETLAARVARGALPVREAVALALEILTPLGALHKRGLIHRDLKPSNVFLTPHGVKLLDFGLTKPLDAAEPSTVTGLTLPGTFIGTPQYMAPEQIAGDACDARSDIWAAGIVLYELLTGRPPFAGTLPQVMHAVMVGQIPPLGGSSAVMGVDRIVQRALSRRRDDRFASVEAMARDLRGVLEGVDSGETARATRLTRLIALPFRMLRPDSEIDFLAFSLADAISTSLSALGSLVVRSTLSATRLVTDPLDLRVVADQADVDVVVTGTLLRAASQVRVAVQLLEAPDATVLWSQTRQIPLDQLFDLQDDLARGIAESLALPLTAREQRLLRHDVPATPRAYEHYLRANQVAYETATWTDARALYEQCVEEDPNFAPAWARLGRMYRVQAKYGLAPDPEVMLLKAEAAFKRALDLNPDLPVAHSLYAGLEVDAGRAEEAIARLVPRAMARRGDADLLAVLVQACRYCGLLDASVAAHVAARRVDPRIPTSVLHTWWTMGDFGRVLDDKERGTDPIKGLVLAVMGRTREAIAVLEAEERRFANRGMSGFSRMVRIALERDMQAALDEADQIEPIANNDPEATYYIARTRAFCGDPSGALRALTRAVEGGYFCTRILRSDPWLGPIRGDAAFARLLEGATARERHAAQVFKDVGGEALLGVAAGGAS